MLAAAAVIAAAAIWSSPALGQGQAEPAGAGAGVGAAETITFGVVTCAPGWRAPNPGVARFTVVNRSGHVATVYLFRDTSGAIVGQIDALGPGQTRELTATLKPGPYAWGCDLRGAPRHVSDAEQVPAHGQLGGPGRKPIPLHVGDISTEMLIYRGDVARQIGKLQGQVATLAEDLRRGDVATAESDWLTAHLTWLDIGQDDGAYGAFGDLGRQIDGTAAGLVHGTADPAFTGFHRIEFDLWTRGDVAAATTDAATLASLVSELARKSLARLLPTTPQGLNAWLLRPHEILEDATRNTLTGNDDYGSGTGLASVTADVAATREVLGLLAPALAPRSPYLVGNAESQLGEVLAAISSTRIDGRWIGVAALAPSAREQVDAAVGAALETLAPIPDVLHVGGAS